MHTLHGPWTEQNRPLYSLLAQHVHLVAISDAQRAANLDVPYAGTVHNGIDLVGLQVPGRQGTTRSCTSGAPTPTRARRKRSRSRAGPGLPLHMLLKRGEPPEREYFEHEIEPLLASDVELYENVTHDEKIELLGRACAMVFPIRWPEPFGLVMIEAMACGTPVVTTNWGAAPELVDDGVTGFRRDGEDDLVEMIGRVDTLDPAVVPAAGRGPLLRRGHGRGATRRCSSRSLGR